MRPRPRKSRYSLPTVQEPRTVVGLDISLSNTGIAQLSVGYKSPMVSTFTTSSTEPHIPRCIRIATKLASSRKSIMDTPDSIVFVREDYAYGAQGIADVNLKELGGIVKAYFYNAGHMLHAMPISSWKKFITGSGNADKALVQEALIQTLGRETSDWTEHDFDAAGIAITAQAVIAGPNVAGLTSYQSEVIESLQEKASSLVLLA